MTARRARWCANAALLFLAHAAAGGDASLRHLAYIWLDPKREFAMVLMTNIAGTTADEGLRALSEAIYRKYAP